MYIGLRKKKKLTVIQKRTFHAVVGTVVHVSIMDIPQWWREQAAISDVIPVHVPNEVGYSWVLANQSLR